MARYRTGTVTVTAGSATINGVGTAFVDAGIRPGDNFYYSDGRSQEIASVPSNAQLVLVDNAIGTPGSGQAYSIGSSQSFAKYLGDVFTGVKETFQGYIDTVLQGAFAPGTVSAPGVRSTVDADTGLLWTGANLLYFVTGGATRGFASSTGLTAIGRVTVQQANDIGVVAPTLGAMGAETSAFFTNSGYAYGLLVGTYGSNGSTWMQSQRVDGTAVPYNLCLQPSGGNLLVGATSGATHTIRKNGAEGTQILALVTDTGTHAIFYGTSGNSGLGSSAGTAFAIVAANATGRSINAAGTINISGADMAEYKRKATGCGPIAKGDVCGVTAGNELTRKWADAIDFVVKTTRPHTVGGDTWGRPDSVTPDGEPIGAKPVEPVEPSITEAPAAHQQWEADHAAYLTDLAAWTARHEAARAVVDRIAIAGQCPVNVDGAFAPGDYVVAAPNGAGIKAIAMSPAAFHAASWEVQARKVGKVWGVTEEFRETVNGEDVLVWPAGMAWCVVSVG